jgi:hypothetical protein
MEKTKGERNSRSAFAAMHLRALSLRYLWGMFLAASLVILPRPAWAAAEGIPCTSEPTDMTIGYGDLVLCNIDSIGDSDVFRFPGTKDELVYILVSRRGGGRPCVELFDPDGTRVASSCSRLTTVRRSTSSLRRQVRT